MAPIITAYFKRAKKSVDGVFSIQEYSPKTKVLTKIFSRMPTRSGSPKSPDAVWARGIGAIPNGNYYLWLRDPVDPGPDFPVTCGGIGKTYRISNSITNHDVIYGPRGQRREMVRNHFENCYKGSAGCIAHVWNIDGTLTPDPKLYPECVRLYAYYEELSKTMEYINLIVFQ